MKSSHDKLHLAPSSQMDRKATQRINFSSQLWLWNTNLFQTASNRRKKHTKLLTGHSIFVQDIFPQYEMKQWLLNQLIQIAFDLHFYGTQCIEIFSLYRKKNLEFKTSPFSIASFNVSYFPCLYQRVSLHCNLIIQYKLRYITRISWN